MGSNGNGKLLDAADNSGIPRAVLNVARVRAAMLLRECARLCEHGAWAPGSPERFMQKDEAEFVLETNQGRFVITVRRG